MATWFVVGSIVTAHGHMFSEGIDLALVALAWVAAALLVIGERRSHVSLAGPSKSLETDGERSLATSWDTGVWLLLAGISMAPGVRSVVHGRPDFPYMVALWWLVVLPLPLWVAVSRSQVRVSRCLSYRELGTRNKFKSGAIALLVPAYLGQIAMWFSVTY